MGGVVNEPGSLKSKQLDVGEAPVEIVGGYVVKVGRGGMKIFNWGVGKGARKFQRLWAGEGVCGRRGRRT